MRTRRRQSGQVLVLVAVALLALIGSAALVLVAGSAEWQKNQLQTLADSAALDSALKIGIGCNAGAASTVITEADTFLATQRTRTGALAIAAGTCAAPYHGTDTFAGGLSADYYYPYQAHQRQVEVVLTLALPISFGAAVGKTSTTVSRYAVAMALPGSTAAVTATTLSCTGGQVNVAGDIRTQNAITLGGGCAFYAHDGSAAGSFSGLGNVKVYADGQTWVNGGGLCSAGLNAGSSNAICADGYELSGHVAPSCAGGASQFLTAANATVNANPCAAGVGRPPVAPLSSTRPPDPNADPSAIATLQGTGGAACTPGGVYPNIVAGGTTWGTGQAPAPIKDASGFWHFKPSCYGYLTFASLAGGISNRQTGAELAPTTHFIKPTLPAVSIAGTLLVANLSAVDGVNTITGPAGWTLAASAPQAGEGWNQIWYRANNPGGITTAQWTVLPASKNVVAQMTEWSGVLAALPLDRTGTTTIGVASLNATVATAALAQAGELVITNDGFKIAGGQTFSRAAGWAGLVTDNANGFASEYRVDLPAAIASETVSTTQASLWSLAIASFKPAAATGGGVLDPGFYYFNGSGFAGGGGLCLNGGELLARDVTLEFVNQAGFSTGTCAPGGGASCAAATCQIGSDPTQALADTFFSWFAAPCSQDPSASPPDVSCLGASSWCPSGDRSCWNLLVWAAAANTGQIAIKGTTARHWLLGSLYWPGTCTDTVNGASTIDGTLTCGTLSISAAAGAGLAVGGDYGISTATVEAVLVE
ncbi:MAG: hypothetical protein E6I34_02105 [Chloroflexi bacterium]|nr:MAG: hypothetical protein E6I34_02105 [Chloroflexota bacterium]